MEVVFGVVGVLLGVVAGALIYRAVIAKKAVDDAGAAARVLDDAKREAQTIRKEAERELGEQRVDLAKREERLSARAAQVDQQAADTARREQAITEQAR